MPKDAETSPGVQAVPGGTEKRTLPFGPLRPILFLIAAVISGLFGFMGFFLVAGSFTNWMDELLDPMTYLATAGPLSLQLLVIARLDKGIWKGGLVAETIWSAISVTFAVRNATQRFFPDVFFFCVGPAVMTILSVIAFRGILLALGLLATRED